MILSTKVICLIFVSLFGLAVSSSGDANSRALEDRATLILQRLFDKLDPIYLPFFPTVGYNPYDGIDFSLSLTDINMTGLASVIVTHITFPILPGGGYAQLDLMFPRLLLHAGEYSAGGHIANMPFTGESFLSVSFEDMTASLGIEFSKFHYIPSNFNFCAINGSTSWQMDIFKPVINFDNLNPGTDQGELVNTMFGAFVPDIVDYIIILLNNPVGNLHNVIDNLLVSNINTRLCT